VSSSFLIRRERPPNVAQVIAALERPGLALAGGDLGALRGAWPDGSLLLWLPGRSSRGVEVSYTGGEVQVRVLAMSSPQDYDLAFRLVEVLGEHREVAIEDLDDPTTADQVRARCDAAWMARDLAAAVTALRTALTTGLKATISGPVHSLEIEAGTAIDPAQIIDILRRAQPVDVPTVDSDDIHPGDWTDDDDDPHVENADEALVVILDRGKIAAYVGDVALDLLDAGPDQVATVAATRLRVAEEVAYGRFAAGCVADLDRQVLVVAGSERPLPAWSSFAVRWGTSLAAVAAYLGERDRALPPRPLVRDEGPWAALARELSFGAAEHEALLEAREQEAAADRAPARRPKRALGSIVVLALVVAVPALVVRVISLPFRGRIESWRFARRRQRRDHLREDALAATLRLAANPADADARHERALALLSLNEWVWADRDLGACLRDLEAGAPAKTSPGMVHYNRSVVRRWLRHPALAAADAARAVELGHQPPRMPIWRRWGGLVAGAFLVVSGLLRDPT
jgi:hypothetical protein